MQHLEIKSNYILIGVHKESAILDMDMSNVSRVKVDTVLCT